MENLTVIIPVHIFNETVEKYLEKAIASVVNQNQSLDSILIVGPSEVIKNINNKGVQFVTNEGETDYCSQINLAVKEINTKYFSILGFDDEYSATWFKNVEIYIKNMPEYSMFFPIITYLNKDNKVAGSVNEIIWAMSFSNEIGVIDEDTLQSYYDFSPNGGVFRTDDFIEVGGLKPSIKLAFWYEFLLRGSNQGLKIYVIPKNGYYQLIEREGSILESNSKDMDEKERAWWIKLAGKEYYFKQERKKSYKYVVEKELVDVEGLK